MLNLDTMKVDLFMDQPDLSLKHVWLDETGCMLSGLSNDNRKVDIYIFEWQYSIESTVKPTKIETAVNHSVNRVVKEQLQKIKEEEEMRLK